MPPSLAGGVQTSLRLSELSGISCTFVGADGASTGASFAGAEAATAP